MRVDVECIAAAVRQQLRVLPCCPTLLFTACSDLGEFVSRRQL
jgi:hypothetical protein